MSLSYHRGNHTHAAQIARDTVKQLDPSDVEHAISEAMRIPEQRRIYAAVDPEYLAWDQRRKELEKKLETICGEKAQPLLTEYADVWWPLIGVMERAWFHLGWAAALRLLGVDNLKAPGGKQKVRRP